MTFTDALDKMLEGHRIRRGLTGHLWLFIPKYDDEMAAFEIMQAWSDKPAYFPQLVTLSREDFTATDWEVGPVCAELLVDFPNPRVAGMPIPGTYPEKEGVVEIAMDDGNPLALDMNAIKD